MSELQTKLGGTVPSKYILVLLLSLFYGYSFAQVDSTKKEMKFDLGITRDQNINLWPIFKRTFTQYETDKQILFPIYRSYKNTLRVERRTHLLPFYWSDSSKSGKNLRVISTFYPSLFHISTDFEDNTKTFTLLEFAPKVNILEFKKSPDGLVLENNLLFFLWYKDNKITQKSHLVVFPAYWQFKSPSRNTHTLLPFYSFGKYSNNRRSYFAITPLLWHFNSQNQSRNILFPLWWNKTLKTINDTVKTNLVLPLYYSNKSKNLRKTILFPIVWSNKGRNYRSFTVAPLFSVGRSLSVNRSHLVITPLFWNLKRDESQTTIVLPILWKYTWHSQFENYRTLIIFPLYWNKQSNNEKSTVIPPFIWSKSTPNYHSFSFIPLFSKGSSPNNSVKHLAITPLFWHFKTPSGYTNTLLPLWWYSKRVTENAIKTDNVVLPVYCGWTRPTHQGNIFFPVLWRFKNSKYSSTSIFPLLSIGKSSDETRGYSAVTPFYWRFKTLSGKGQLLFPIWFEKQRTIDGEVKSTSQVILLYWRYKDTILKHQGVFPMFWRFKGQNRRSFTLFPFVSTGFKKDTDRRYLAISPIFWHFSKPSKSFTTLFPVWWSRNNSAKGDQSQFKLLIPIYFSQSDPLHKRNVVFPIVWRFKNPNYSSFTLVPFFSYGISPEKETNHLALTPLFWHFKNPNGSINTLLPIFWHSRYGSGDNSSENTILFPIYFQTEGYDISNRIIFPIIWSLENRKYKSFSFIPLFSYGRNEDKSRSHYAITPLYYNIKNNNSSKRMLFPLWWNSRNGNLKSNILFPVYWSFIGKSSNSQIVFPIVWNFSSAKSKSLTIVPLFSKGVSKNGLKHLMVTPLYWNFSDNSMNRSILFPIFNSYSDINSNKKIDILFFVIRKSKIADNNSLSIVWPIIKSEKANNYKYFRFAPLVWSKRSSEFSYFTIQPFYYWSKSEQQITHRFLWEFYVNRNVSGIKKSNSILWKVVTWDRYSNGDKSFRVLYLLYANSNVDGNVEKSLFPLYYFTKDNHGNKSLSVALYFYNSLRRKIPNTTDFYQEERIFWLIRIRSNYRILKEKGISID